ncbi:unnamed protein product [Zymoseptoria tritici ST99CH_1A5]|uniref:Chitin-binding type-2 domain-containing protein n=2 Tax=Zymoseptoria tritici TaxID=1047171 RepID=A0A1X7RTW8_ZYMT9|nr:unnamed protein product [Zymoseptoria tritici ST99CH_3D7]SMR54122.1 unnamed protein product [Zymoseptoria tritici ST99CH_3D1]SMY24537.1 unnamed protein product [Zymoseptoria tritici ST99CH_1A5]
MQHIHHLVLAALIFFTPATVLAYDCIPQDGAGSEPGGPGRCFDDRGKQYYPCVDDHPCPPEAGHCEIDFGKKTATCHPIPH